jgi:hypothetical protein
VRLAEGIRVHFGVAGQVYREDAPDADIGTVFDAAFEVDRGAVYAIAESAVRTGEVPAGSERVWTAGAWGQVTFDTPGAPFDVAPMAGFDFASGRDALPPVNPNADVVRGRGGVTLPWRNAPVTIGVEGDITSRDSSLSGGVFAWGQVGI